MDIKFVKHSRTMAENESRNLPEMVKSKAIELRNQINTELQKLDVQIETRNIRALTEYTGDAPILIDGINLILTKMAMFMQKKGIKRLEDVNGVVYDRNTNLYSIAMPMDKFVENMLGDFTQYASHFKRQCSLISKSGNKIIWSREKKLDANGNVMLDEKGTPITTLSVRYGQAISVQFKAELDVSIDKEYNRLLSLPANSNSNQEDLKNQATINVMSRARNLQAARTNTTHATKLPRETAIIMFNGTLFEAVWNQSPDCLNRSFFYTTPYLQLKLMTSIQAALDANIFGRYANGFLNAKQYMLNAQIARQALLYLLMHDNGHDFVYYDVYDFAESVLPSFIDKSKGRYISPRDQKTIRWIIFKICTIYSIMLCKGLLDGNFIVPVFDMSRIYADTDNNTIRLVHSNSKNNFSFSDDIKRNLLANMTNKLGFNPLLPLLENKG